MTHFPNLGDSYNKILNYLDGDSVYEVGLREISRNIRLNHITVRKRVKELDVDFERVVINYRIYGTSPSKERIGSVMSSIPEYEREKKFKEIDGRWSWEISDGEIEITFDLIKERVENIKKRRRLEQKKGSRQ